MNRTYLKSYFDNTIGLYRRATAEIIQMPGVRIADVMFSLDKQLPVVYTLNGWCDFSGNRIMNNVLYDDFETGITQWKLANDTVNKWIVGTDVKYAGTSSAYISNNNTNASYDESLSQISHMYKEINLPDSEDIKLSFFINIKGETFYDYGQVYLLPEGILPQAGVLPDLSYLIGGIYTDEQWGEKEIDISDKKSTKATLVFTHRNDGTVGANPGFCVDNVRIDSLP